MRTYREELGSCLIEARARNLDNGRHWQPWLRLTRHAGDACARETFAALKPVFGSERAALRYAAALGKSLATEKAAPDSGSVNPLAASLVTARFAWPRAYLAGAQLFAKLFLTQFPIGGSTS